MKKQILTAVLAIAALTAFAQQQDVMVIEKTDNTTLRLSVDDIRRVIFESAYLNPIGTLAEAVDLGLPSGVRWAKWNLGASSPSDYGGYYGWGDSTGQKTSTNVNDYPSVNPPSEISGTQYDIASIMWGGQWRIPTYDDIYELYEKCEFYRSGSDVKIVGPNGNSIILPLAGSREGTEIYDEGNFAYYWSSTIPYDDNNCAWLLNIDIQNGKFGVAGGSRHFGLSIRPVWGTPKPAVTISVTTGYATDITQNSARVGGTVSGADSRVTVGIVYGTTNSLSVETDKKMSTTSMGGYSVELSGLTAGTTYYYCAYAEVDGEYYYGEVKNFTTEAAPEVIITVKTEEATDIGETSAKLNGSISVSNAGAALSTRLYELTGFFVATSGTPSSENYIKKVQAGGSSNFSATVTGLTANTTYYFCAYGFDETNYYYGETKSFTTDKEAVPTTGTLNGHDWVDLGLPSGTKWATCNIGASSPTAYGYYYAWGETTTKSNYVSDTYAYRIVTNGYVSNGSAQDIGANISGTKYDAARSNWGSTWRMPTETEFKELREKCNYKGETQNGVYGLKVTGPNGNSIFLPSAGLRMMTQELGVGEDWYYWSATEEEDWGGYHFFHSKAVNFSFDSRYGFSVDSRNKWDGLSIRPVTN